jgi:hypothetical protein
MLTRQVVEADFALLVFQLAGIQAILVERLDGETDIGVDIDGSVDNTVRTHTQNASQFKPVG